MKLTINNISKSINGWQKHFNVINNEFFNILHQQNADFLTSCIQRLVDDGISNISEHTFKIQNKNLNLIQWANFFHARKYHFYNMLILTGAKVVQQELETLYNKFDAIHVNLQSRAKTLVINNISNSYPNWANISGTGLAYLYQQSEQVAVQYIQKALTNKAIILKKNLVKNIFTINDISATWEDWSVFIGKSRLYFEQLVHVIGEKYAYQHLQTLLSINLNFSKDRSVRITIDGVTRSLYYWSRIINCNASLLYNMKQRRGLDTVINYIRNKLNSQNNLDAINIADDIKAAVVTVDDKSNSLMEWASYFGRAQNYFLNFASIYGLTETNQLIQLWYKAEKNNATAIKRAIYLTVRGETKTLSKWARQFNILYHKMYLFYKTNGADQTIQQLELLLDGNTQDAILVQASKKHEKYLIVRGIKLNYRQWSNILQPDGDSNWVSHNKYLYGEDFVINVIERFLDKNLAKYQELVDIYGIVSDEQQEAE